MSPSIARRASLLEGGTYVRAPLSRQRVYPSVAHTRPHRGGMPCLRQSTVARCASNPHARGYKSITRIPTCTLDLLRGCTEGETPLSVARASFRRYRILSRYRPRLRVAEGVPDARFRVRCVSVDCQKAIGGFKRALPPPPSLLQPRCSSSHVPARWAWRRPSRSWRAQTLRRDAAS